MKRIFNQHWCVMLRSCWPVNQKARSCCAVQLGRQRIRSWCPKSIDKAPPTTNALRLIAIQWCLGRLIVCVCVCQCCCCCCLSLYSSFLCSQPRHIIWHWCATSVVVVWWQCVVVSRARQRRFVFEARVSRLEICLDFRRPNESRICPINKSFPSIYIQSRYDSLLVWVVVASEMMMAVLWCCDASESICRTSTRMCTRSAHSLISSINVNRLFSSRTQHGTNTASSASNKLVQSTNFDINSQQWKPFEKDTHIYI